MSPKINIITLGAADLEQTRPFYEHGLGAAVHATPDRLVVQLGGSASPLELREWETLASEAGVDPEAGGFRAFTLSYVTDSADAVDELLARVENHGGRISKPPKNALWGYSAYVTDPSGHLWKVASSKRRPLVGGRSAPVNGRQPVTPQEVPITLGVADMKRAKAFYGEALGLPVKKAFGNKFVMFGGDDASSDLGLYKREALAKDAAVDPRGSGFSGLRITQFVGSVDGVGERLARIERAGARVISASTHQGSDSYNGCFADPDGNLWRLASDRLAQLDDPEAAPTTEAA